MIGGMASKSSGFSYVSFPNFFPAIINTPKPPHLFSFLPYFPMADDMELQHPKSNSHSSSPHLCSQIILRALVISSTLAATFLILSANQSLLIFGIPFHARYTYSSAFIFFAFANAIASAFCFLSACFLFLSTPRFPSGSTTNYYIFFLHDLLIMALLLAGCSSATAIGYVGKYGNSHAGWSPICDHFGKFCNRLTTSLAISYFALLCLLILIILSANPPSTSR